MSPGPATYRSKLGFDSIYWNDNNVRSPNYIYKKLESKKLSKVTSLDNKSNTKKQIIRNLYGQLASLLHNQIKVLKQGI